MSKKQTRTGGSSGAALKAEGDKPPQLPAKLPAKIDGEKNWKRAIEKLKAQRNLLSRGILLYRHSTGGLAVVLAEQRTKAEGYRKYGNHTVHDISVELAESDSTIYACMKFTSQTSSEQLQHLIDQKWAWRAVAALVTVEDPKVRKQLQNKYEKGQLGNSDALKEAVAQHNDAAKKSGLKTEKRGGGAGSTAQKLKGFITVSATFVARTVPEFCAGIESFASESQDMSPRTSEIAADHIQAAKETIPVMREQLDHIEAVIKKLDL